MRQGAKRFFRKAFPAPGNPPPRVVNVDHNPAYPAAVEALKSERMLPRRVRLSVQIPEQRRRAGSQSREETGVASERIRSFQSAWRTLQGIATMHMIHKGRVRWLAKGDAVGQAHLVASLFGIVA